MSNEHTTHQGAVGAETMTAAIAWLEKRLEAARSDSEAHPEGHSNRAFYEAQAIAYENVLSLLEDGKAATPAPRTDGGMTAGEVTDLCDRLDRLNAATDPQACAEAMDEARSLILRLTTPAQAGAVPDGLRALSEAATKGRFEVIRGLHHYIVVAEARGKNGLLNSADADFAAASANYVRDILATHPAGQSAGSGAEEIERLTEERDERAGAAALNLSVLKQWRKRAEVAEAALAARPAASEAQGAWLPISTAPKDGTHVIAHDEHYGVCEAVWRRAFDDLAEETFEGLWDLNHSALNEATGWQPMPAPPASSGQEG